MSDSSRPHGLQPTRLLCPWDSPGKSTGVDCHFLLHPRFDSWVGKIHWRKDRLPTPVFLGFPYGSAGKESACNVGDLGSIPGLGRSPGEGKGYSLQYSGLENSTDCIVHGVAKSQTSHAVQEMWVQSLGWEYPLEKGKATHSSILAWRIPWTKSMGSQSVRHD